MRVPLPLIPAIADTSTKDGTVTLKAELSKFLKLDLLPTFNTYMLCFNCDKVDADLRKTISLAVNRKEIVDVTTHGTGVVSSGPLPLNQLGYQPPYIDDLHNLPKAKRGTC